MHFCKANHACVGTAFALSKQTDDEIKLQEKLQRVFEQPSLLEDEDAKVDVEVMRKDIDALYKRMQQVQQLSKEM